MVAPLEGGTYLNTDVVLPGVQVQLEQRIPIYGQMNELDLKANAMLTWFYYESQFDVDLRFLVLTLGLSAGFRNTFVSLELPSGGPFDHDARSELEDEGDNSASLDGFGEGRATLSLPFNDNLAFQSVNGARFEGGPDRTYDWRLGIMRDSGVYFRSNNTLFFHHRKLGAIGPHLEVLNYALDGERNTEFNYGFTYVGRLGFRKRFDLIYLNVLFGLSGTINGVPTEEVYGDHWLKVPFMIQLAYRIVWDLSGPREPGSD